MKYIKGFRKKNKISFLTISNRKRKEYWYKCTYDVNRQRNQLHDNRLFHSYDLFHYTDENTKQEIDLNLSWADISFPSKKSKNIVYLAYLATCQYSMMEEVHQKFLEEVLEETKHLQQDDMVFKEDHTIELKKIPIPHYEGRDRFEEIDKRFEDWILEQQENPSYEIYQEWSIDKGITKFAVPLNVVIDIPYFHVDTVNNWINTFYEMGEIEYKSPSPVSQENLIYSKDWMKELQTGISNPLI